ncbi:MAG: Wzz/FepE/Etk N-terminal domain-containing protein [Tissierellaceae bacterium]|nr:Wzz/FepE/Etk N-terminal domain-containing protein [Tissierellaceae bacterium]
MSEQQGMEEISLRELIEILIKRKNLIAVITAVSIALVGIYSFFIAKPVYEVEMILMASNSSENLNSNTISTGNVESMLDSMAKYPSMNIETYKEQIKTPAVINRTMEDLHLEDEFTVESFARKITLETVKDTQLIKIKRTSADPERAAMIVNKVGENFIEVVSDNIRKRATSSSEYVKDQMEKEKAYYDEALLEQKELLSQPRSASEVELELNAKLAQITAYKSQLKDLNIKNASLQSAIEASEKSSSRGSSIVLNRESGNILIDDSTKTLKIELAEAETTYDSIQNTIEELQGEIEDLQVELQDKKHKENIISQKVNIAQQTYEAFMKKYEELRVTESAQIGESSITIISKAYPTTVPVGPRKALNLAISAVLGLMIGVFAAFFIEYWQSTEE